MFSGWFYMANVLVVVLNHNLFCWLLSEPVALNIGEALRFLRRDFLDLVNE